MRSVIYETLKQSDGYVSGEALSASLGVTRAALWKHIKAMQEDGAEIESVTGMGYHMIRPPDVPRAEYLTAHVHSDISVFYQSEVTSTNDTAKQAAQDRKLKTAVFIAGKQTAGKGRKGRIWQSPKNEGVYMSFLVRPKIDPTLISGMTIMVAVMLCNVIEQQTGISAGIKWPNDILIDGKKVCGILTESMLGMDGIEYVVCGMGINTGQTKFEDELKGTATSLGMYVPVNKMLLASAVIDAFITGYQTFLREGLGAFIHSFRERNVIDGTVTVISPDTQDTGIFAGFDDTGAILVNCHGQMRRFVAGEVSLRGENSYV